MAHNCNEDQLDTLNQLLRKSVEADKLLGRGFIYDLSELTSILLEAGYCVDFHFTESIQKQYSMSAPVISLTNPNRSGFSFEAVGLDKVRIILKVSIGSKSVKIDTTMDEVTSMFVSIPGQEHTFMARFNDIFSAARMLHLEKFLWSEEKQKAIKER